MGGCCAGRITDIRDSKMEENSGKYGRMEATFEGSQGPEGAVVPWMDGCMDVKARRISWIGHVERMEDNRMPKRVMREKIYTRIKRGRPKIRWLDDVQEDLREMGTEEWRRKVEDRDQWRRIAQETKADVMMTTILPIKQPKFVQVEV
jgi:hypothetical protein